MLGNEIGAYHGVLDDILALVPPVAFLEEAVFEPQLTLDALPYKIHGQLVVVGAVVDVANRADELGG